MERAREEQEPEHPVQEGLVEVDPPDQAHGPIGPTGGTKDPITARQAEKSSETAIRPTVGGSLKRRKFR